MRSRVTQTHMEAQQEIDRVHELLAKTEARMTWETHQGRDVTDVQREVQRLRTLLDDLRSKARATRADSGRD